ncbi:MAG: ABC transporter permease, partial [Catenulispora sp.]|nr:ABC transporter permease [Catenulispora sp.]
MTTVSEGAEAVEAPRSAGRRPRGDVGSVTRTFLAVLWRDVYTTTRRPTAFLLQVIVQPLLLFFVFGKVLGEAGYTRGDFGATLLPGVM